MPILTKGGDSVDEVILTHVRQILQTVLIMRTVIRQIGSPRIGETVGSVRPRERVRINRVFGTGFIVIEVQTLQYLEVLLYLVVRYNGFVHAAYFRLEFRTIFIGAMVDDSVAADIEPVIALIISFGSRTHIDRIYTA